MGDGVRRRTFIGGATAVALLAACGDDSDGSPTSSASDSTGTPTDSSETTNSTGEGAPTGEPNAFRRSSRHVRNPCAACVSHNRNRYYATAEDAEADPPHEGCNCEVRGQVIAVDDAAAYFSDGRTVYDKRSA